ncbi:MAG: D-alanine--D-alanine ligase [Bacteroidetes bacterium HGW-Bacteroidetes-21]|jgi:D-alanine-D-alanine ligase|nr:MAG: D-alanine--D-alanine ligase [Bacteroidetes bacterium HGW-Bacteroidetes-21]
MKNIAILAGGYSSERVISVKSAAQVHHWLDKSKYNGYIIDISKDKWFLSGKEEVLVDKNDFSITLKGEKIKFDFAYIIIHGTPGEDGLLQGYLETAGIPHSTCDTLTGSLTFNKYFCKTYLEKFGIVTAKSVLLKKGQSIEADAIIKELGLPVFVKPNNGGSSFGTTKVKEAGSFMSAVEEAFKEDPQVIVEEFIAGREITCGVFKSSSETLLFPVTEIITQREFFDYEAKYLPGVTREVTPAEIPDSLRDECQQLCSRIYDLLNCKGIVRVDYIVKNDLLYFLEINTVPGMSEFSIIPQQAAKFGIEMKELLNKVIEDCSRK